MNEQELLSRELAKVGAVAGSGGSLGALIASRFLPTEYYQTEVELNMVPQDLLTTAYSYFENNGQVFDEEASEGSSCPKVSGVVGSGLFNMNPTVIHVEILDVNEGRCAALLTGNAKEGLIKQRSAEKAVNRFLGTLAPYTI